jgi:predicted Zn-dependent peptidase
MYDLSTTLVTKRRERILVGTLPTITAIGKPREPARLPATGDMVGRYTVLEQIGAGAIGAIFLASDPDLHRRVALKLLAARGAFDVRLLDEARALARLQHPNVVAVHDVGRWQGQVYLAMEYVAGRPLDAWLREHEGWERRLDVFVQAALGLAAAHRSGIVHHDVKPSNIMVGDDGRVRLVDFGLARAGEPGDTTSSGGGTPRYMSPEQRSGATVDARTDQFSLCVALYEALFGEYPFEGDDPDTLHEAVLEGRVRMPAPGPVLPATRDAVLRGLAPDPAQRHPSMDAFIAAVSPPPPPRRRASWIAATAGLGATALAGIALAVTRHPQTPTGKWDAILEASHLPPVQPEPLSDDPRGVTVHRLSNGLTVYISPSHDVPRIRTLMRFHVGQAEAPGVATLAMMMSRRGTEQIGTTDYAREKPLLDQIEALYAQRAKTTDPAVRSKLDAEIETASSAATQYEIPDEHTHIMQAIGVGLNSMMTYRDQMQYDENIPSNRFAAWADLEADRWSHPAFRMFRSSVAETLQWDHRKDFNGVAAVLDAALPKLYAGQPFGYEATALNRAIATEPMQEVEQYFRTWFVPNNADLFLVGDVDPVTAIPLLEKAFAGWEPRPLPERAAPTRTPLASAQTIDMPTAGTSEVVYHWIIPAAVYDDPALDVLRELLDNMLDAARPRGTATTVFLSGFSASVMPAAGQTLDDAGGVLDHVLERIRAGQFSEEDLAGAKRSVEISRQMGGWSIDTRMFRLVGNRSQPRDRPWRAEVEHDAAAARVTRADAIRVAHAVFDPPRLTVREHPGALPNLTLAPPKVPAATFATGPSKAARALLDREVLPVQPKYIGPGNDLDERETPNGHLLVRRDAKSKLFRLRYEFHIGYVDVPPVCEVPNARLEAIRPQLAALGISVDGECYAHQVTLELTGLDDDLPKAFELFGALIAAPTPEEWATVKSYAETQIAELPGTADWIELNLDYLAMFGPDLLWRLDPAPLRAMTVEDAGRTAATLRATERFIGYYGPRSIDEIATLALPKGPGAGGVPRVLRLVGGKPRVLLINAPKLADSANATILFGVEHMMDGDGEPRFELLAQYFSDTHPLNDALRGPASFETGLQLPEMLHEPGHVAFRVKSAPREVVASIDRVLHDVFEAPPEPARFAVAKADREERLRSDWIPRTQVPTRAIAFRIHGQADDPRRAFFERLTQLSVSDLSSTIDELRRAPRVVTIWGNLDGIDRTALAKLGDITELTIPELLGAHAAATAQPKPKPTAKRRRHR